MTSFILKVVACLAMLIDHIGAVFPEGSFNLRLIGRLAFPVFVFLAAESCRHTRDLRHYLWGLLFFALLSEIPYDIAFKDGVIDFLNGTNVFYTLAVGVWSVYVFEWLKGKGSNFIVAFLCSAPICLLGDSLHSDYGWAGALLVLLLYVSRNKPLKNVFIAAGMLYFYAKPIARALFYGYEVNLASIELTAFALLSLVLINSYNGQRGGFPKGSVGDKISKWCFYAFYPFHIIVLVVARFMLSP